MSDKLNFSLPKEKTKPQLILIIIVILLAASLAVNIFMIISGTIIPGSAGRLKTETQKELALKLQKQSLYTAAAQAWKDYLVVSGVDNKERAAVWYGIGKIYQEAGMYEQALDSYYRSEAIYKRSDIKEDLGRRIQDSLEMMGKFAALRYELADRLGMNEKEAGSEVLAEIGTEKITRTDLDKKIEEYVDFQVAQEAASADPDYIKKRKEQLFKQYTGSNEARQEVLKQYVNAEILYRKAREEKLAEESIVRELIKETEKQLLAIQLLKKKTMSMINITENDLKAYYEAEKGDYIKDGKQQGYDQVKNEIYNKVMGRKQQEVSNQVIDELWKQYNVVIHTPQIKKDAAGQK